MFHGWCICVSLETSLAIWGWCFFHSHVWKYWVPVGVDFRSCAGGCSAPFISSVWSPALRVDVNSISSIRGTYCPFLIISVCLSGNPVKKQSLPPKMWETFWAQGMSSPWCRRGKEWRRFYKKRRKKGRDPTRPPGLVAIIFNQLQNKIPKQQSMFWLFGLSSIWMANAHILLKHPQLRWSWLAPRNVSSWVDCLKADPKSCWNGERLCFDLVLFQ